MREQKKGRESRDERGGKREKSRESILCATLTPHQYLTFVLTLFDYFTSLNQDMANLAYRRKLQGPF